ncbi:MAG: DUF3563 domain-containing protein [Rhodobacteraceae bacterium]|jgi:hypothetical protein|nr:DUF3563 domain-containing protein [Paracoccaceae bacterium]
MPNPLRNLTRRLHLPAMFPSVEQQELAYLNAAQSIADLEWRQREIDLGLFRRSSALG